MLLTVDVKVNHGAINGKIDAWANSDAARRKMEEKIDEYINKDKRTTDAGSRVVTKKWMQEMAEELCGMITANASTLPASVAAHVSSLQVLYVAPGGLGSLRAYIDFMDTNMQRISLAPEIYGFTDNIVVQFEKGWDAANYTYGYYNGERIRSRKTYPGAQFIHKAVAEFNAKYASLGVIASIPSIYG